MGTRIHKVIGYGLKDIKGENNKVVDERLNPEGYFWKQENKWSRDDYISFLKTQSQDADKQKSSAAVLEMQEVPKDWNLYNSIIYQGEYGLPTVLCFVPASCSDWRRYDDIVDYVEEINNYKVLNNFKDPNRLEMLSHGIFPYDYRLMDARSGAEFLKENHDLGQNFLGVIKIINHARQGGELLEGFTVEGFEERADKFAEKLGFKDRHEGEKYIGPAVPLIVQFICRFSQIFRDEKTIFQLRPMLYVYWS